jgi:hypothetical protein
VKQIVISFFLFCCSSVFHAQTGAFIDSTDIPNYHQNIFLKFFLPKGIAEGVALRSYLRSSAWDEFRKSHSDPESFDEIFEDANELCYDNRTAAILASSIAVLEHKTIPLKLFFGITLQIPLTMESQQDFDTRVSKLPEYIYDPKIPDRDKLQHFFFSAYFMQVLKMNSLVKLLGDGVEIGEDLFIVGGVDDPRDRHANSDGRRFGTGCGAEMVPAPSFFLTANP